MSISAAQDGIINEFALLDGDMEMTVLYIMELGQKLAPFPEKDKAPSNEVKGCQSKVWMTARSEDDRVFFQADSNTAITKGLISLLIRIFSGQKSADILGSDLYFMRKIGMERFIGTQRTNGFAAMIKQMKIYALAFLTKAEIRS